MSRIWDAKLVFNMVAGGQSADTQLAEILAQLADANIQADVYRLYESGRPAAAIAQAVRRGIPLVIAAGGDNTVSTVGAALVSSRKRLRERVRPPTRLGILPTGTRNNIARSLDIPTELSDAVAVLVKGHDRAIDVMAMQFRGGTAYSIEVSMVGLGATIFPAADEVQKGDLRGVGELVTTLVSHAPAKFDLTLDGGRTHHNAEGHLVLVANIPLLGANFLLAPDVKPDDGLLDVFVYPDLSKLDLLAYLAQLARGGEVDERIQHFRAASVRIQSTPPMDVLTDGVNRPAGPLTATLIPRALNVLVP